MQETAQPLYKKEFVDYDDDLPSFAPFVDSSWHNNACPSFLWRGDDPETAECEVTLWCDYKDPANRECINESGRRFTLSVEIQNYFPDGQGNAEGWYSVLVAETLEELREAAIDWYKENVGYDVAVDVEAHEGKPLSIGRLLEQVGAMYFLHHNKQI